MDKVTVLKAVIYVVRDGHLLVFRHLDFPIHEVGIQVPAGTIRPDESPEEAALRELREETGYSEFRIDRMLGTAHYDISPYRNEIQERHFFLGEPTTELPDRWTGQEDHDGLEEPTRFEFFWIPLKQGHVLQAGQGAFLSRVQILIKVKLKIAGQYTTDT